MLDPGVDPRARPRGAGGRASEPGSPVHAFLVAVVYLAALAWLLGKAALFRSLVPFGVPPDEPAHVSYAASVGVSGPYVPRYESARLLDDAGRPGPLPNYLPHPSLYYLVAGAIAGDGDGPGTEPLAERTRRLRLATAPLFAAGAALFLFLGARRRVTLAEHVAWAATVAAVPPFAFVGAAVNNDALAFLAGGLALLGLSRRLEGRTDVLSGLLVGAGLALALLSKATAGLLVGLTTAFAFLLARRLAPAPGGRRFLATLLPGLLVPALHYAVVLARYGTPLPTLSAVAPGALARSAFVAPAGGELLSLGDWVPRALKVFASTGLTLVGHVAVPVGPPALLVGPALLLGLAAWGLLAPAGPGTDVPGRALALSAALASLAVLLLNFAWSWAGYLETGRLAGLHVRYYLPLLPALALAAAAGVRAAPSRTAVACVLAALLVAADADVTARFLAAVSR
jgi:hypothetical protein